MSLNIDVPEKKILKPKITVLGVGGAGCNAVNNMISLDLQGVDFVVANTDAQALENSLADTKIQLGEDLTKGLGAGSSPEVGAKAAEESINNIVSILSSSNMVFLTAGMGGGTGTGAAPIIAKACREQNILTVGVVTKPFHFEGAYRMEVAEAGVEELFRSVDTLIVIPNQNLFHKATENTTFAEAFNMVDNVLYSGIKAITDLMTMPGLINLDFADIRTIMGSMGKAMMGTGESGGEKRALEAAEAAISNPLLDNASMKGASGVLINISGGLDMTLFEADEAAQRIRDEVDSSANIIFGSTFDKDLDGKIRVSVVATGISINNSNGVVKPNIITNFTNNQFNKPKETHSESKKIQHNAFIPPMAVQPQNQQNESKANDTTNTKFAGVEVSGKEAQTSTMSDIEVMDISDSNISNNLLDQGYQQTTQQQVVNAPVRNNQVTEMHQVELSNSEEYTATPHNTHIDEDGKKPLSNFFNFFKESINVNEFNNNKTEPNINDQNHNSYQENKVNYGSSVSDEMLNVPAFTRKKGDRED